MRRERLDLTLPYQKLTNSEYAPSDDFWVRSYKSNLTQPGQFVVLA